MRARFLLLVFETGATDPTLVDRLSRQLGLGVASRAERFAALVGGSCACLPVGESGVVLGTLFHRHGPARPLRAIEGVDAARILETGGDRLLSRFWGGYIAALQGCTGTMVIRDPSAGLPCYFAGSRRLTAFASDAALLIESGLVAAEIDWPAVGAHLYAAGVPGPGTAIAGIRELLAGFAIDLPGPSGRQRPCWSPWAHTEPTSTITSERLAAAVNHSVASWASERGPLLLSCSGGLDSSIVAVGLARCGADATCLTMYADDPGGDERLFARVICERLGLPLIERAYRIEDIDIDEPLGAHLPRPSDRLHALSYERAHLEAAAATGAAGFMTGNGGDSVFGYSQSAAAAADRYLCDGFGEGLWTTLRDICVQTGCSLLQAATSAFRIVRGPRAYSCRPDTTLLSARLVESLDGAVLDHPWLHPPADALPGKAAHIASVLRMQQCLEPTRGSYLPVINPLMSQPVLETCLGVPTWEWRAGGRDRSLARTAFARELPPAIVQRRLKGGPDGFAAKVLDHFRDPIRERLLDGHLARHAIVDRTAVEVALSSDRAMGGEMRARVLELVATEAWAESWLSRDTRIDALRWQSRP
jgi:asparagine synthase (glutamine-hydrolysing)